MPSKKGRLTPSKKFGDELKKMADEIVKEANGLTCADCPYSTFYPGGSGYCFKFVNPLNGEFLRTSKRAPACKRHPDYDLLRKTAKL
jgi:hypothetical protein